MLIKIAIKIEMLNEARVMQHAPGIATHGKLFTGFNKVMFIQSERMRMMRNRAAVYHCLSMILARQFQIMQFEQSISCRIKTNIAGFFRQCGVIDTNRAIIDQARIGKALSAR